MLIMVMDRNGTRFLNFSALPVSPYENAHKKNSRIPWETEKEKAPGRHVVEESPKPQSSDWLKLLYLV